MKNYGKKTDFTQGDIIRSIVAFSMPIVMGELLQNLYNSVDALVVGNLVSSHALAAVTVSGVIANMLVNFFNGMSVGTNVVISRAFGKGDAAELKAKIGSAFSFAVFLGVLLSLLGILFTPEFLRAAGAQAAYYQDALRYLRIYLAGLMFTVIYNNGAGILRATGDSGTPFRILLCSCLTNIILDLLFVGGLRLGVAGVALATVCSQALSVFLVYTRIRNLHQVRCLDFGQLYRHGRETVRDIMSIGMAAGMQSALINFSNIFVVRYMNLFSTQAVAGIGIAQRLDKFIVLPAKSFGITMTTFVSQNLGAEHYNRIRDGKRRCLTVALAMTLSLSAIVYIFANECVALFNPDAEVVFVGVSMMRVLVPLFWIMAVREVYLGILRGYGYSTIPMILALIGMVGVRQVYLAIVMHTGTPDIRHIYYCYPIAWFATTALLLIYYRLVRKNMKGLEKDENASEEEGKQSG